MAWHHPRGIRPHWHVQSIRPMRVQAPSQSHGIRPCQAETGPAARTEPGEAQAGSWARSSFARLRLLPRDEMGER
ncbi:hypothetical protein L227DRAFT_576863 [Lentinus tigrinus ALCF2SS1-6]|uniref:Uncharacterized protein n=2 Tax=Lentinus tigrinus TaxID=5365 RepID=A0A5C2S6K6_9APHY|nr:hypothetical protein L227DRAFT_576863 [Lentinus tigrinus ALCF2SS1-6]